MATIIDLASRIEMTAATDAAGSRKATALAELRRARMRISQLERDLAAATRYNLFIFNWARDAERRLNALKR